MPEWRFTLFMPAEGGGTIRIVGRIRDELVRELNDRQAAAWGEFYRWCEQAKGAIQERA